MKLNKIGFLKMCLFLGSCTSFVQFIIPAQTPEQQTPVKKSLWDKLTGKGKIKVTLIKANLEERKEPWSYQVIVENSNIIKPIKTFYRDATISFDLADGPSQSVKITGGTGFFAQGVIQQVITDGELDPQLDNIPMIVVTGTPIVLKLPEREPITIRSGIDFSMLPDLNEKKKAVRGTIQLQIDQLKGMKSVSEKIGRGATSLKAGANQVWQALKKD